MSVLEERYTVIVEAADAILSVVVKEEACTADNIVDVSAHADWHQLTLRKPEDRDERGLLGLSLHADAMTVGEDVDLRGRRGFG